jgi:hypothetical protein
MMLRNLTQTIALAAILLFGIRRAGCAGSLDLLPCKPGFLRCGDARPALAQWFHASLYKFTQFGKQFSDHVPVRPMQ